MVIKLTGISQMNLDLSFQVFPQAMQDDIKQNDVICRQENSYLKFIMVRKGSGFIMTRLYKENAKSCTQKNELWI